MVDPTVVRHGQFEIAQNAYVGPFCVLGVSDTVESILPLGCGKEVDNRPGSLGSGRIGPRSTILSHVVLGEGTVIGSGVWCDHHTYIGRNTQIGDRVQLMYGARVYDRVTIGEEAWVAGFVCNDAIIGPRAVMMGQLIHRFVDAIEGRAERSPVIDEDAFVGMQAVVIGGIEVGAGAYIAAGAVLTMNAEPRRLYVGVPAKNVGPAPHPFRARRMPI